MGLFSSCSLDKPNDKLKLKVNKKVYNKNLKGKRILLYGDSISSDYYSSYAELLKKETGAEDVFAAGFSGYTMSQLAQVSYLQRIFDYNADVIICLFGGNDTGEENTVGTFGATDEPLVSETYIHTDYLGGSFIQGLSHVYRKIEEYYSESEEKPFVIYCTSLPQKRSYRFNPYSKPENWLRKRNAIVEVCGKYDIKCIDLYNLCEWNMNDEPYYRYGCDPDENRGVFTMDGLHPNPKGYADMARIIKEELSTNN